MSRSWRRRDVSLDTHMTITVGRGEEHELPVRIEYSYLPGQPATPPAYSHGGLPPDPPEVEIRAIIMHPKELHAYHLEPWLLDRMQNDDELLDQLMEHADDEEGRGKDD